MFIKTFLFRLKLNMSSARGIVSIVLALVIAVIPFIGLSAPNAAIPIGWIDEDNSGLSELLMSRAEDIEVLDINDSQDETEFINRLQTGDLEGVIKVPEGFEEMLLNGEYEGSLIMMTSPYSTAFEIIAESVGRKTMEMWVACYTANLAKEAVNEDAYNYVFKKAIANESEPILVINQLSGSTDVPVDEKKPVHDAAKTSLYLLCAFACFYMLAGLVGTDNEHLAQRLLLENVTIEKYRLALSAADAVFILPCLIPSAVGFAIAGEGGMILPFLVMFALYLISFGGVASLLCKIESRTAHMLTLILVIIVNLFLGSMLLPLPAAGFISKLSYILPSRWISAADMLGVWWSMLGMIGCAVVYNALPFVFKNRVNRGRSEKK